MKAKITKSVQNRTLTGTLGGIAEYTGFDYMWLKIIFVILILITKGFILPLYLIASLVMPRPKAIYLHNEMIVMGSTGRRRGLFAVLGLYIKNLFKTIKLVLLDSVYAKTFGLIFLGLGLFWFKQPLPPVVAALLVLGVILLFNPFGLDIKRSSLWIGEKQTRPN